MATGKINMTTTTHETLMLVNGIESIGITRYGKLRIINFDFTGFQAGRTDEITLTQSDRPLLPMIRTPVFLFDGSAKVFAFVDSNGSMGFYNTLTITSSRGVGELVYVVN